MTNEKDTNSTPAKPFIKWAGGKKQLLPQIIPRIPRGCDRYIEPFIGGGAVLFSIAERFKEIYISDTNAQLIGLYQDVKSNLTDLIERLKILESEYTEATETERIDLYYANRDRYNQILKTEGTERSALFIFLNRTCFNGLYRVNAKGFNNVPAGKYKNPKICDAQNLRACSNILKRVKINCMSFEKTISLVNDRTFVYCDPPYRPLSITANFNTYTNEAFNDLSQKQLAAYANDVRNRGGRILLSNSDPHNVDPADNFIDDLYRGFTIDRIPAARAINRDAKNRGAISELLINSGYLRA